MWTARRSSGRPTPRAWTSRRSSCSRAPALDADVQAALDALPEAFRQAVWLRDVEELSYAEIARVLDVPIGTVMSRISRGRRALVRDVARAPRRRRAARRHTLRNEPTTTMSDGIRNCRDFEERLTPYVDGDIAHGCAPRGRLAPRGLSRLPRSRSTPSAPRRDVLRDRRDDAARRRARGSAPSVRGAGLHARRRRGVRRWLPLSLAATLLLAVAAVFLFGLNQSVEALAAGLTLDHVNCFKVGRSGAAGVVDAHAAAVSWQQSQGWPLTVPETAPAEELRLVDVRRCLSPEGRVAHLMYLWRGEPLSVYVLPRTLGRGAHHGQHGTSRRRSGPRNGRTYAVLATGHPQDFDRIVGYVKAHAE